MVNRRWLATCLYQQGELAEAQRLFRESLEDSSRIGDQRSVIGNTLKLVAIDLDRLHILRGDHAAARENLTYAIDLFERLGMRRDLEEARAAVDHCLQ